MVNPARLTAVIVGLSLFCYCGGAFAQSPGDWPMFGQSTANTASNSPGKRDHSC